MNIDHMRYFLEISKWSNVTRASESLHITQPALTKAIHQLEEEVGVQLFMRKKNRIFLTREGALFAKRCRSVIQGIDAIVEEMRDYGPLRRKTVRTGIPATIGTILLPKLDVDVRSELDLEMEIFEESSIALIHKILSGELDLAFVLLENDFYPDLEVEVLSESSLCFCTGKCNPLSEQEMVDPSGLFNERIIVYKPGAMIQRLFKQYEMEPKYTLHTNQVSTIKSYLKLGLASTFQFPEAFEDDEDIVTIPLVEPMPLRLVMIRNRRNGNFKAVSDIFDYVRQNKQKYISGKNIGQRGRHDGEG